MDNYYKIMYKDFQEKERIKNNLVEKLLSKENDKFSLIEIECGREFNGLYSILLKTLQIEHNLEDIGGEKL